MKAVARFAERPGIFEAFGRLTVKMKSRVYSNLQRVQTIIASVVVGCQHTNDINEVLVPNTESSALFGRKRYPDQSHINGFPRHFGQGNIGQLQAIPENLVSEHGLCIEGKSVAVVDTDQTSLVVMGKGYGFSSRRRSLSPSSIVKHFGRLEAEVIRDEDGGVRLVIQVLSAEARSFTKTLEIHNAVRATQEGGANPEYRRSQTDNQRTLLLAVQSPV